MASFKGFMDQVVAQAPPPDEPVFRRRLREHFGTDPAALPIVAESFERSDHPNLHLALDEYVGASGRAAEILGVTSPQPHMEFHLAQLTDNETNAWMIPREGPVEYVNVSLHDDQFLACVQSGLYLIRDVDQPLALLVRGPSTLGYRNTVEVEVMARERRDAELLLGALRDAMRSRNVYRGHVISLAYEPQTGISVQFHRLPSISREGIVLPPGVLERIERQTVGFARHGERLRRAGRHLKRGLLLHGAPGTGKTLTAMYLAGQMRERTILLLTGQSIGLIAQSCAMARLLQPATIILEDVDLIAQERTHQGTGTNAVLFELLNRMDGLAEDVDVVFLLTTNRPEILEPALAARPGRIDQAIEVPLPDRECRRRLFDLYARGLEVRWAEREWLLEQTEGVSPAFIRELMRKAALFAADEAGEIVVEERHLREALHELVVEGGALTLSLLGAAGARPGAQTRPRDSCG